MRSAKFEKSPVTERVLDSNHRIFPYLQLPAPSQSRRWLDSSPIGGAKGGCAAGVAYLTLCAAGFLLSYLLHWAALAVTERVVQPFLNDKVNLCTHTTKIPVNIPVRESQNLQP